MLISICLKKHLTKAKTEHQLAGWKTINAEEKHKKGNQMKLMSIWALLILNKLSNPDVARLV